MIDDSVIDYLSSAVFSFSSFLSLPFSSFLFSLTLIVFSLLCTTRYLATTIIPSLFFSLLECLAFPDGQTPFKCSRPLSSHQVLSPLLVCPSPSYPPPSLAFDPPPPLTSPFHSLTCLLACYNDNATCLAYLLARVLVCCSSSFGLHSRLDCNYPPQSPSQSTPVPALAPPHAHRIPLM